MINVLHIIHKYRGNYPLLNLQASLDPERFRTVVCFLAGEDDGKNELEDLGVKTYYLNCRPRNVRWHNISLILRLKRLIEGERIHVVNCQQHRSTPVGVLASLLASGRPAVLSTLHGLGFARTVRRKFLNWILYRRLYKIIGISEGVTADILNSNWGLSRNKVATVRNGLLYDPFLAPFDKELARRRICPDDPNGFWFGTAGRLSPVKNHETLISAFASVCREYPQSRLLIAGTGELEDALKSQVASLGLDDKIHFLGYRDDIPIFYKALDVFVLPSLREGFGLALAEAMASTLPVVAASVGGVPEFFEGTDMGYLVDPRDPDELARAMMTMASLPESRLESLGEHARKRAIDSFSADQMIKGYEEVYAEAFTKVRETENRS